MLVKVELNLLLIDFLEGIRISPKVPNGITAASFKSSRQTKFYIHGFLANGYEKNVNVSSDIHLINYVLLK